MIRSVTFEKTTYNDLPFKFEAGTPDIAARIALGAAIDYLNGLGIENVAAHEKRSAGLRDGESWSTAGRKADWHRRGARWSVVVCGQACIRTIGAILDRDGIAIRTGHHCAQP